MMTPVHPRDKSSSHPHVRNRIPERNIQNETEWHANTHISFTQNRTRLG